MNLLESAESVPTILEAATLTLRQLCIRALRALGELNECLSLCTTHESKTGLKRHLSSIQWMRLKNSTKFVQSLSSLKETRHSMILALAALNTVQLYVSPLRLLSVLTHRISIQISTVLPFTSYGKTPEKDASGLELETYPSEAIVVRHRHARNRYTQISGNGQPNEGTSPLLQSNRLYSGIGSQQGSCQLFCRCNVILELNWNSRHG